MAEGSARGGRSSAGPVLLALIFLSVLGGGAGLSLGTLARDARTEAGPGPGQNSQAADAGTGGNTDPVTGPVTGPATGRSTSGSSAANVPLCPRHTEDQASDGQLTRVLYLRTAKSEVWVCKAADGTLFYQGHSGQPGENLVEHVNALFLKTIEREGADGYVATNTDQTNGRVTKYHVTTQRLVIEHVYSGDKDIQPAI